MGRTFNSTSDSVATSAGNPTLSGAAAGTVAFWVRPTWAKNDGASHAFFAAEKDNNNRILMEHYSDNDLYFGWRLSGTFRRVQVDVAAYTLNQNQWNAFVYLWDASASPAQNLYLNGSSIGTYASINAPDLTTATRKLGTSSAYSSNLAADMAEVVICNYWWSARQIAAYSAGYSPLIMAPDFTLYLPLLGGTKEWKGIAVTDANTSNGDHPRIIYPHGLAI